MNCIAYYKYGLESDPETVIQEFADRHGLNIVLVLSDDAGRFDGFRELQTHIKLDSCDAVLMPSRASLGDDHYMQIENELFMDRNGVRLIFTDNRGADHRHALAVAIHRYFSLITDRDAEYGTIMPLFNSREQFKRKPPIGYSVIDGELTVNERDASIIKEVFLRYANGDSIADIMKYADEMLVGRSEKVGNMTVKTILRNERYLGRMSKKGYHLPPIITFDLWCRVHERLEKEYGYETEINPYFNRIYSDRRVVYARRSLPRAVRPSDGQFVTVDSDSLERRLEALTAAVSTVVNAHAFYTDYVLPEAARANEAYPKAAADHNKVLFEFRSLLDRLKAGDRSAELQERLDVLTDRKNVGAMRLRRIASERDLFSITEDQTEKFFSRAANVSKLSVEERSFIAEAFIWAVRIRKGRAMAYLRMPADGSITKHSVDCIL